MEENGRIDKIKNGMEELMDEIRPIDILTIKNKCRNESFARVILWMNLYTKSRNTMFISTKELSKFMRYSIQRARYVLQELVNLELLRQVETGKRNEYIILYENEVPKISQYIKECRETLKLKLKMNVEQ